MLTLVGTTDTLRVTTSTAAPLDCWVDYIDAAGAPIVPLIPEATPTAISSATTTTICAAGGSSGNRRNVKKVSIRNKSAGTSNDVLVFRERSATGYEEIKVTLKPGETLEYIEDIGWYIVASTQSLILTNESLAQQTGFAADTYLTGSNILIPAGAPLAGTTYKCSFDVTKTAAGTATIILNVRIGTAGTTADTSRLAYSFGAGTAVADSGRIDILVTFRTVGSGTSAVIVHVTELRHQLASTGLGSTGTAGFQVSTGISSGFDSTVANSIIGVSYNGGASAAHTINLVRAELTV